MWILRFTACVSLALHAGVTTCVCLSWASFLASGGPWPSCAGSATGPSVSYCRPSTFPTCTACGKPGLYGGGSGDKGLSAFGSDPHYTAEPELSLLKGVCWTFQRLVKSRINSREQAEPGPKGFIVCILVLSPLTPLLKPKGA